MVLSLLWHGFIPWPWNFCMMWAWPNKKYILIVFFSNTHIFFSSMLLLFNILLGIPSKTIPVPEYHHDFKIMKVLRIDKNSKSSALCASFHNYLNLLNEFLDPIGSGNIWQQGTGKFVYRYCLLNPPSKRLVYEILCLIGYQQYSLVIVKVVFAYFLPNYFFVLLRIPSSHFCYVVLYIILYLFI